MAIILSAVLPVGTIVLIGFLAGRLLNLEQSTLAQLSIYLLAPALVANSLYRTSISLTSAAELLIGYGLISLILYTLVLAFALATKMAKGDRQSFLAITLCPNNGNMGLPVVAFALGERGLERAIVYMIGSSILLFGITPALLKGEGLKGSLRLTLKLPLVWAMLAGILLNAFSWKLPYNLDASLELLGMAAIPIALLLLGLQLTTTHLALGKQELLAAAFKLAIAPLIAWGIGNFLNLRGLDFQVLVLQTAMPTAINSLIMVQQFGGNATMVARGIVLSTLASFISLPLIIWLVT